VSGNHEVVEDENTETQQAPATAAVSEEKKDIPFKKPVVMQEHMKTTSIKDVLVKHQPQEKLEETSVNPNQTEIEEILTSDVFNQVSEEEIVSSTDENADVFVENETEVSFVSLQDCWEEAVREAATEDMMIAVEFLLKQNPVASEENSVEVELPNEVAKQEVRQILPTLNQCLIQKTGIPYSIDIKVVKVEQEKKIDTANPDEKFKQLCQENPALLEFKQRLNLSIS